MWFPKTGSAYTTYPSKSVGNLARKKKKISELWVPVPSSFTYKKPSSGSAQVEKIPAHRRHDHRGDEGGADDDAHVRGGEPLGLAHHGEEGRHEGEADGAEEKDEAEDGHVEAPPHGLFAEATTTSSVRSSVDNRVFVSCRGIDLAG